MYVCVYCGILKYADDILLLRSSITKLQLMVDICMSFGIEMGVTFSLLKSNCLAIYPGKIHFPSSSILFDGDSLNWSNKLHTYVTLVFLLLTILKIYLI